MTDTKTKRPEGTEEILSDPRWKSIVERDRSSDGKFFYSVRTTGVYCRPSCAARLALPENVQIHITCAEAEKAGFRPCKRCKPDQPPLAERNAKKVAIACRMIERSEEPIALARLAAAVEMSTFHFHRLFKSVTGLTPND